MLHLALQRLISYHFVLYHYIQAFCLCKNWHRKLQYSYLHVQTDSGMFAFHFCDQRGMRQESYLPVPRLYKEHGQTLGYKFNVSFIIHVNFDHAWAEHYSITLNF